MYQVSNYEFRCELVAHIDSCINLCTDGSFISRYSSYDQIEMVVRFALVFVKNGCLQNAAELREKVLEASQRTLGDEHPDTLRAMNNLANSYSDLGHRQEAAGQQSC